MSKYSPKLYETMKKWRKKNYFAYREYEAEFQRGYIKKWRKQYFKKHPRKLAQWKKYMKEYNAKYYSVHRDRENAKRREYYRIHGK